MSEGVVSTSEAERERAFVVRQCVEGRLSQGEASVRLWALGSAKSSGWCGGGGGRGMGGVWSRASGAGRRVGVCTKLPFVTGPLWATRSAYYGECEVPPPDRLEAAAPRPRDQARHLPARPTHPKRISPTTS